MLSRTPPSRMLLLTPSRTCLDAAASLPPLWASNDSVLHLLLCEGLCIFSFDSLYYATPYLFSFSICRRQWWLSLLDLLCSERIPAQHCMLFSIDIGITPASSLLRGYTKLEPLTIAEISSSSLPSHRISPSYAPMSIADETAEGLFVGIDGAGEGVNSEEEEARLRAEREAAEREVARVRMRQE
ncbi:hypothetical protein Bca52824_057158 [Brassica carinata]|uniref:Uncharacterized protein n=1 Tax=Brassica carinata TaxID=52824 RepID=A0A8X7QRT3_BRACI|nr:hypothetical protein Bca52824_057158 [Brassica carinata]